MRPKARHFHNLLLPSIKQKEKKKQYSILKIAFYNDHHATQNTDSTAKENELENFKEITVSTASDR